MDYTILRPSAFMEQHVHLLNGKLLLEKGFVVLIGPATKPRNFVAVRDVVPFAVMALTGDVLNGRTTEIGGPDNLSNTEVAHMYAAPDSTGPRPWRCHPSPMEWSASRADLTQFLTGTATIGRVGIDRLRSAPKSTILCFEGTSGDGGVKPLGKLDPFGGRGKGRQFTCERWPQGDSWRS